MRFEYRGYEVIQEGPTSFYIPRLMNRHGSAFSAKCYIDEYLSP